MPRTRRSKRLYPRYEYRHSYEGRCAECGSAMIVTDLYETSVPGKNQTVKILKQISSNNRCVLCGLVSRRRPSDPYAET